MARQPLPRERNVAHFPAFEADEPIEPISTLSPFSGLVKRLSEAYGPSGSEQLVRDLVRDEIKKFSDQVRVDALGNLIAQRRGIGNRRKKIMLSAHLDEIGVMVTFIDTRGFARFSTLGPVKPLTLLGARVRFEDGTIGIIGRQEHNASRTEIDPDTLYIDVGAPAENSPIHIGDAASFVGEFHEAGNTLIGKALNNRLGCAVLIETLRQLKKSPHDLFFVFTVQRQVGARGAGAAAFAIQPDFAFVLDTAAAVDVPGAPPHGLALGKGPAIKFQDEGALTSAVARQMLINLARELHLPYQPDVTPRTVGDSLPIQATGEGVPTGALALPLRNLNTTSELAQLSDAENTVKLLLGIATKG